MNRKQAMQSLVESCSDGFGEAGRLLQAAIERMFSDDSNPPPELAAALGALDAAIEKLEALDVATQ